MIPVFQNCLCCVCPSLPHSQVSTPLSPCFDSTIRYIDQWLESTIFVDSIRTTVYRMHSACLTAHQASEGCTPSCAPTRSGVYAHLQSSARSRQIDDVTLHQDTCNSRCRRCLGQHLDRADTECRPHTQAGQALPRQLSASWAS